MTKKFLNAISPGRLIDVRRIDGAYAGSSAAVSGQSIKIDNSGTPMMLSYTPPVDVTWDVHALLSNMQCLDAVYLYAYLYLVLSPADTAGRTQALQLRTGASSVTQYNMRDVSSKWSLAAGVAYTCTAMIGCTGNWQYYQASTHLFMEAMAFAR